MNHFLGLLVRTGLPAIGAAALCVFQPALAAPPAAVATSAPAPDLVAAVDALRAISTMRADFVQTNRNGQRVSGVLTMKRPGRIRFQYEKGVPILIVGDGRALTFVDMKVRQTQRWPIGSSPLGALLDPKRDAVRYGRLLPSLDRGIVAIEVRDPKHPEYGVIELYFTRKAAAPGGLELSAWIATDSQNTRTAIRLSNQQYGMALDDSQFRVIDSFARPRK